MHYPPPSFHFHFHFQKGRKINTGLPADHCAETDERHRWMDPSLMAGRQPCWAGPHLGVPFWIPEGASGAARPGPWGAGSRHRSDGRLTGPGPEEEQQAWPVGWHMEMAFLQHFCLKSKQAE